MSAVSPSKSTPTPPKVAIVFAMCASSKCAWRICRYYLRALIDSGILRFPSVALRVVVNYDDSVTVDEVFKVVTSVFDGMETGVAATVDVHAYAGNQFEYRGLHAMWEFGADGNFDYVLYFHNRGATRDTHVHSMNKCLVTNIVMNWHEHVARFDGEHDLNLIGFLAHPDGFMWFNFFWARASYLRLCRPPECRNEYYYYEAWIGKESNGARPSLPTDCFNFANGARAVEGTRGPHDVARAIKSKWWVRSEKYTNVFEHDDVNVHIDRAGLLRTWGPCPEGGETVIKVVLFTAPP